MLAKRLRGRTALRLGLLVLVLAGLAAPGVAHAAPAAEPPSCDLPASGHAAAEDEARSCLSVGLALESAPAVGETARLTTSVRAAVAGDHVRISVELPPNLRWQTPPTGTTLGERVSGAPQSKGVVQRAETERSMAAGEVLELTGTVTAVATGPAEILAEAGLDTAWGGASGDDQVFITVAPAGQHSRFGYAGSTTAAAVRYDGPAPAVSPAPTKALGAQEAPPASRAVPQPSDRSGEPTEERSGAPGAVTGFSCVYGSWNFVDNNGVALGARQWRVEAWDDDSVTGSGNDFLAAGLTNYDGSYSLCFNSADTDGAYTQDVYVVFIADNGNWRLEGTNGGTYSYGSGVVWNITNGASYNIGWLQPSDPTHHRGAHAFQAVSDAWNGTPGACWDMVGSCRAVVIRWAPDSYTGNFYDPNTNLVRLKATAPDSRHIVVHEVGHSIMDDVYDDAMPSAPNCASHSIPVTSSKGCAWVEGFADWFPTFIYNDKFFRWSAFSSINLETPTWDTPGWSNFDSTEGRVAGALMDLYDTSNEGFDVYGEGINNIWYTFQHHNSTTFREFWTHRSIDGFTIGTAPRSSLHQNTIDY